MNAREILTLSMEIEEQRKKLAQEGNLDELCALYNGTHVELPLLNSPAKWDFYADRSFKVSDPITRERIQKTLYCIDRGANVLDYGCGYCYLLKESIRRDWGLDYAGVDFSLDFVEKCQELFPSSRFYLNESGILKKHRSDYVLALEVLEHILPSQTLTFLSKLKLGLKPGGKLLLSVPVFENLELLTCPCWSCGQLGNPNGHVRSYTPDLLCAELKLAGYSVFKTVSVFGHVGRIRRIVNVMRGEKRIATNVIALAGLA